MTRRQRTIAISMSAAGAALALVIGLIVTLTGSSAPVPPASPSPAPSTAGLLSPFTGEPVAALGPVVAVKIDNIKNARPPTGLRSADIIYALPVEGGLSRLMAVFSSRFPPVIGRVRSAREDDLELLRQFGRPAFAYSGAAPHLLPFVPRPPYAVSTGSGRAVVLRDGRAFDVRWSRPSADGGTTYTLPSGQRMTFAPGQVWVVLASAPTSATRG